MIGIIVTDVWYAIGRSPTYQDLIGRFTHGVTNSWVSSNLFPMIYGAPWVSSWASLQVLVNVAHPAAM